MSGAKRAKPVVVELADTSTEGLAPGLHHGGARGAWKRVPDVVGLDLKARDATERVSGIGGVRETRPPTVLGLGLEAGLGPAKAMLLWLRDCWRLQRA